MKIIINTKNSKKRKIYNTKKYYYFKLCIILYITTNKYI